MKSSEHECDATGYLNTMLGGSKMTQSLHKQAKLLLFIFSLFSFASLLSGTFIPVYLWKQSESYLHIGFYVLGQYMSSGLFFYLCASLAKQGKKRLLMQLGCGVVAIFYGLILFIGAQAQYYVFLLGSVYGIGQALYWLAYNIFYFEITEAHNRDLFNGWQGLLVAICSIIAPFMASRFIEMLNDEVGYRIIFISSLVIYAIIVVLVFKLEQRAKGKQFDWLFPLKAFSMAKYNWKNLGLSIISQGIREGMFLTLLPFIVFLTTSSEGEVGLYTLISAVIALIANYLVGKKLKQKQRKKALFIGALGSWLAILFIIIKPNLSGLLLFGGASALIWPLFIIPFTSMVFDRIGQSEDAVQLKEEIIVFRELSLMLGRIIGLVPFFIYSIWLYQLQFPVYWLLLLVGICPVLSVMFIKKVNT